jgi:hypothetical protein
MKRIYAKFVKKQQHKVTDNLPDLIRKINKNELMHYERVENDKEKEEDPLYIRINIDKLDYITEYNNELTVRKRIYLRYKYFLARMFDKYRYEKSIKRDNIEIRQPLYERFEDQGFSRLAFLAYVIFMGYVIGYFYAKFRYDVYIRRYMYIRYTSFILAFEAFDYKVNKFLKVLDYYFPLEMSDTEYEFIVYKKIKSYLQKRKLKKQLDLVMNTDKEVFELDNLMKKIK